MAIQVKKESLEDKNPKLEQDLGKIHFCRAAVDGGFSRPFYDFVFEIMNTGSNQAAQANTPESTFILKQDFESANSYKRRAAFAIDPEYSGIILNGYVGLFNMATKTVKASRSQDITKRLEQNIDGSGTTLEEFCGQCLSELGQTGAVTVLADGNEVGAFASIIKRENLLDWELLPPNSEQKGKYKWIKYKVIEEEFEGIERKIIKKIIVVDSTEYQIWEKLDKDWRQVGTTPNPLGYVPAYTIETPSDEPIISIPAKIQFDEMNMRSEVRHSLSIQALRFLGMSSSMAKSFTVGTANSIICWDDDYSGPLPQFIAPQSDTFEPHFKLMDRTREEMRQSIWINKSTNGAESGEAKKLDWKNVELVLSFAAEKISNLMGNVLSAMVEIEGDSDSESTLEISKEFIKDDVAIRLQNFINATVLGVGDKAKALMRIQAVQELLPNLTPDEFEEIKNEIENLQEAFQLSENMNFELDDEDNDNE